MPIGSIEPRSPVQINNAIFRKISETSNNYRLELTLVDPYYDQVQHAVGGPLQTPGTGSELYKAQEAFQLPSYVIRILKKTTPTSLNYPYNNLENLWKSYDAFNSQDYRAPDGSIFTADGFGVGLTPFYYQYTTSPWTTNNVTIINNTYNNGVFKLLLDASGGVALSANNSNNYNINPLKQVSFNPVNPTNPIIYPCRAFDSNKGFTEPGGYLIIVMRNAIDNITTDPDRNNWIVDNASANTRPSLSARFVIITPPNFNLTYDPVNDLLSFTVNSYGSANNINSNGQNVTWGITNQYKGTANFSTNRYPYDNNTITGEGQTTSQGFYTTSSSNNSQVLFTPTNPSEPLDSNIFTTTIRQLRILEESYVDFTVRGAFMYDFRLSNGTNDGVTTINTFNPYASQDNLNTLKYSNYVSGNTDLNTYFKPNFENVWLPLIFNEPINRITIRNNSESVLNPIIYSNPYDISASIHIPIELNTTIYNIGNNQFIFRSEWTELFPELLRTEKVNDKYVLRLYKQSKTTPGNAYTLYDYEANNQNYKYISDSNTGLLINTLWNNDGSNNKIIVYTDKNGNTSYNNQTISSPGVWNENQIRGGWFMVLQRNFTNSQYHTDGKAHITTQGCFVHYVETPVLNVVYEVTNKFPIRIETEYTNEFINAKNYWSQRGTGIYSQDENKIIELSQNILTLSNPTINEIRSVYNDYNNHQLFNRVEIDFGIGDDVFVENLGGASGLGFFNISKSNYTGNTFYDASSNYVDINTPRLIDPIILDMNIVSIGNNVNDTHKYAFKCEWSEPYYDFITKNVYGSEYILRLYKRNPSREQIDSAAYLSNPMDNFEYISTSNSGLAVNPVGNWYEETQASHKMNIVVDKVGNIYYLKSGTSLSSVDDIATLNGNGWSQEDIFGGWIMVLQRNFTFANSIDVSNINTQACFDSNFGLNPTLIVNKNTDNLPTDFITTNTAIYANADNNWGWIDIDNTVNQALELNSVNKKPNPNMHEVAFDVVGEVKTYAISLFNRVEIDFSVGSSSNSFSELFNGWKPYVIVNSNINKINQRDRYFYDVSTNTVTIYEKVQSNDNNDYLKNINFDYDINSNGNVYFKLKFNNPDDTSLAVLASNPEVAFDINIFKKNRGYGTSLTQWIDNNSILNNYKWENENARGKSITKNLALPNPNDTSFVELNIDISGNIKNNSNIGDLSGTFETGGYIVVVRRNFKKSPSSLVAEYVPLNCFTINSQYIFVPPSQNTLNYSINIPNSSVLQLSYNETDEKYTSEIPVYNSYAPDGSFDIDLNLYVRTNETINPVYRINNIGTSTNVFDQINSQNDRIMFELDKSEIIKYAPDYGPVNLFLDISYNWYYDSDVLDLSIGQIGGIFNNNILPPVIDVSNISPINTVVLPNKALTNTTRLLLPSNTTWNARNRVSNIKADFLGDDTNRMLAIKWDEPNPTDLCNNWTGYEYAIRVYKKRAEGATSNEQWYDPIDYKGIENYRKSVVSNAENNVVLNEGLGITANFYSQSITSTTYMYFFADAAGKIFYNDYPADESVIVPFRDTEAGGYLLVVQREYASNAGDRLITTTGKYFGFIPPGADNPHTLNVNGTVVTANPTPFSSFNSASDGGDVNIQHSWTIELPNIEYFNVVSGENSNTIDTNQFINRYRNRDKVAFLTSRIKYNFSVDKLPLIEEYPLSEIEGTGFYEVSSTPYKVDLCIRPESYPPPPWARFTPECPDPNMTPEEREKLQMRRKAETLKHLSNQYDRSATKTQHYAYVAKGYNQRRQTYATQTDSFTDPNTKNYPVLNGRSMTLPSDCPPRVLTFPSTCSDVPGPIVPLTYDPTVPLVNYKTIRTYPNSLVENFENQKTI